MARETESEEATSPPILSKEEETEAAFWRLKRASDEWREDRVKRVLAQEGESPLRTLGRVLYVSACVLFDGLILTEIPVRMGKTTFSWLLLAALLVLAIKYQREYYGRWFDVDTDKIDFSQP